MLARHRPITLAAMLLTTVALTTTAQAQDAQTGGVLRILATGEPDHMDPTAAAMVNTNNYMRAVSRLLVSYNSSNDPEIALKPVGDLAVDVPQPTDDGLTYTFKLRPGVMWNTPGGPRPITAADVERGMKRNCNPSLGSFSLSYYTALIAGMAEFCDGYAKVEVSAEAIKAYSEGNDITGIETPDDQLSLIHI